VLEFNVGEIVTRLRTALAVRGRMPLGLDEVVIPTMQAGAVDTPPFRVQPVEFHGTWMIETAPATAGRNARVAVFLQQPATPGSIAVISRYKVSVSSYVTATGALDPALQGWEIRFFTLPSANVAATQAAMTSERYVGGIVTANTIVQMGDNNAGVSALPAVTSVTIDGERIAPGGTANWVECAIPLYDVLGLIASTTVSSTATSQARLSLSVVGQLYTGITYPA